MRKGQGDGDWEPDALELGTKLRKARRKINALEKENAKLKEEAQARQERPPCGPASPPPGGTPGLLHTSPSSRFPSPPRPAVSTGASFAGTAFSTRAVWVAWEANRGKCEAAERERALQEDYGRTKAVRKAFAWKTGEGDPVLMRAAKGFWQGTDTYGAAGDGTVPGTRDWRNTRKDVYPGWMPTEIRPRRSKKQRVDIFNEILVKGFNGAAIESMTKVWNKSKRFSVVRLAKVSDMDSTFNPTAVGAIRACMRGGTG